MLHQKSKKILIYFFLFLVIGTLNNRNLSNIDLPKINNISIKGLDEKNEIELINNLNFLRIHNLFFLDKIEVKEIINSNNLVEKYSIFKKYPSSLEINIYKAKFFAYVKRDGNNFFLGSNGKLIKTLDMDQNIPTIFGNFNINEFFDLKENIDQKNLKYTDIKNLYFFKSGRWDIETHSGLLIKLPKDQLKESLKLIDDIIRNKNFREKKEIDLRQLNQVIING